MTAAEATRCLRRLTGLWPSPGLTPEEALTLRQGLTQYTVSEFEEALELLTRQSAAFRPPPAEVLKTLRSTHRRRLEAMPALPAGEPAAPEVNLGWLGRAKQRLGTTAPWHGKSHAKGLP